MRGQITEKTWLDLRETAALIGREILDTDWKVTRLDGDEHSDPILQTIRRDIIKIIDSGEVRVCLDTPSGWKPLPPHLIHHEFSSISLEKNTVHIAEIYGPSAPCWLHAKELRNYLERTRHSRWGTVSDEARKYECFSWLCSLMANHETGAPHPRKTELLVEARARFGVGKRPFERIWKDANEKTGSNWSKPGRPKSSR